MPSSVHVDFRFRHAVVIHTKLYASTVIVCLRWVCLFAVLCTLARTLVNANCILYAFADSLLRSNALDRTPL